MDQTTLLYIVLVIVAAYAIYVFYIDYEDFNNSTVRSDPAGDKSWCDLSIRDKIEYLEEKQSEIIDSSHIEE